MLRENAAADAVRKNAAVADAVRKNAVDLHNKDDDAVRENAAATW